MAAAFADRTTLLDSMTEDVDVGHGDEGPYGRSGIPKSDGFGLNVDTLDVSLLYDSLERSIFAFLDRTGLYDAHISQRAFFARLGSR